MSGPAPRAPGAYGMSLRARLRNLAAASGRPAGDLHREHLLQRFLARVFADPDSGWVLKGGTGLLARLPGARHSEDIDLLHPSMDLTDAVAQLREVAGSAGGDPYRFVVDAVQPMVGGVDGAQVRVTAYLGAQKSGDFRIDLATAVTLTAAVERRTVAPIVIDPDVAELPEFVLYPLADQVADKVCAMYERHGPDQLPSSRYRDLVDLALIVGNFDLDAAELAGAFAQESGRRGLRLPSTITSPGPVWARQFPQTARDTLLPTGQQQLETALAVVGRCLDPVLAGERRQGRWRPAAAQWVVDEPAGQVEAPSATIEADART